MTTEVEKAIQALKFYIENKPEHCAGLCFWLTHGTDDHGLEYIDGHSMIARASDAGVAPPKLGYLRITNTPGPTAGRVKLARSLLHHLKRGNIRYDGEYGIWRAIKPAVVDRAAT